MSAESPCDLRAFFYRLVHSIAGSPASVEVTEHEENGQHVLTIFVAAEDFARFREQGGRTLRTLNTVLTTLAKRDGIDATMQIIARPTPDRLN